MQFTSFAKTFWQVAALWLLLLNLAQSGLAQNGFPANSSSTGDPTIVRPQGFSVQTPLPNGSQQQPINPPIVQANGQRVFPNAALPSAGNSNVQKASWTTSTVPGTEKNSSDNLKKKSSLELKPPSKEVVAPVQRPTSNWASALSIVFSLTIVVCLFLTVAWVIAKAQPKQSFRLPAGVVQVLGRSPMAPRQQVYVVRFGNKMLLVSHQPGQTQTLAEITDPDEIARMAGMCEASQPNSISHSFKEVLSQVVTGRPDREPRVTGR